MENRQVATPVLSRVHSRTLLLYLFTAGWASSQKLTNLGVVAELFCGTACQYPTNSIIAMKHEQIRDVTDSASESDGIRHFLKSEIRRMLKIRSQRIYGFRNCCFSPIYLLFLQLFS